MTSVRTANGNLKLIVWRVSSAGVFTRLGDSGDQAGDSTMIQSALSPLGQVVTAVRAGNSDLKLIVWGVSSNGATVQRLGDSGTQAGTIGSNSLIGLSNGVVSAVRTGDGSLRLIGWSIAPSGAVTRMSDSGSQAGAASLITLLPITGVGGVTMVTAVRTASSDLKLISWGPACVRLHVKILQQPNSSLNQMIANMTSLYASVGIGVTLASTENLNLPQTFLDVDVGQCILGTTTA